MKHQAPIVFIGPSGAGKSTLTELLLKKHPDLELLKTYTTRPRRSGNDNNHIFVDASEFQTLKNQNKFIGIMNVYGASYGLPTPPGGKCIMLLRADAILEFKRSYPDCVVIEIDAPVELLKQRLANRRDLSRLDSENFEQEITLGRKLANLTVDTSQPLSDCLRAIENYLELS